MTSCLNEIVEFLHENPISLETGNSDGRLNSAGSEDAVLKKLSGKFRSIELPGIRNWYDFRITGRNDLFVNLKISDLSNNAADNCSAKLGMGYALTGIKNLPMAWEQFHKMLEDELKIGFDYYFLVVNKNSSSDCFWTSLKRIKKLVPNGNNLPFQCDWSQNREFSGRSEIEAMRYILEVYIASWSKKVKGYPFKLREMLENNKLLDSE